MHRKYLHNFSPHENISQPSTISCICRDNTIGIIHYAEPYWERSLGSLLESSENHQTLRFYLMCSERFLSTAHFGYGRKLTVLNSVSNM